LQKKTGTNYRMFALETIGYFPSELKQQEVEPWLYQKISPSDKEFIAFVSNLSSRDLLDDMEQLFTQSTNFPLKSFVLPGVLPGVKASDHWSFWKQGYQAVMVTDRAWARYLFCHTTEDTAEKLDYIKMAELIKEFSRRLSGARK
jgi:hypothetical protein